MSGLGPECRGFESSHSEGIIENRLHVAIPALRLRVFFIYADIV